MTDDFPLVASENEDGAGDVVTSEELVEEVSIDGMCGVY